MNTTVYIHLIFLCVLNITFFFSGVILNSLVIITFWKATQLRKKLCHFMIMVLSCFDLITILTGTQRFFFHLSFWLPENHNLSPKIEVYQHFVSLPPAISMLVLLLMCIERYLGAYYPVFHRTSVTRRRLLASLAISTIFPVTLLILSQSNMVISDGVALAVFLLVYLPPFIFFNYKLFKISRKMRLRNIISPETRTKIKNLKNISSCLFAVACLVFFYIPIFLHIGISAHEGSASSNALLWFLWAATIFQMNCTFNCLIFFWKNKVLQIEGKKVLQAMKARVFGTKINIVA